MEMTKRLRVSVVPYKHLFVINQNLDGTVSLSGIEGKLFQSLMDALKVPFELLIPPDKEWGKMVHGNWTGMIGMIVNGEADMAVNVLVLTEDRIKYVDFSLPYGYDFVTFATLVPKAKSSLLSYLHPFNAEVWWAVVSVVIALLFIFRLLLSTNYSFSHIFAQVLGSISRQPLDIEDNTVKGTILVSSWLFWVTIITFGYSAVLLSFLTVPPQEPLIKTHWELYNAVKNGRYRCYTGKETIHLGLLKSSTIPFMRDLGEEIQKHDWFMPAIRTGNAFQLTDNTACIAGRMSLDIKRAEAVPKKIFVSEDTMNFLMRGIAWRKDFCCKDRFNTMLGRMISAGLDGKYMKDELTKIEIAAPDRPVEDPDQQLKMKDVAGAFIFLAFGLLVALTQFIAEIVYFRFRKRKVTFFALQW